MEVEQRKVERFNKENILKLKGHMEVEQRKLKDATRKTSCFNVYYKTMGIVQNNRYWWGPCEVTHYMNLKES
jgi:hypothetical protein